MAREYFCAYHSYAKSIRNLSDAECGRLFKALLSYSAGDTLINLQGREGIAFDFITEQIDRDNEAYEAKCAKNRANGERANGTERPRMVPNAPQGKEEGKEEGKEKDKEEILPPNSPPKGKRFTPPSVEEVKAYCLERKNGLDAQAFVDFYSSKGWKVGNNPMKDWKAAVRTWENRRKGESPKKETSYSMKDIEEDMKANLEKLMREYGGEK